MNTPPLYQDQIMQPTVAQLFGSNNEEEHLRYSQRCIITYTDIFKGRKYSTSIILPRKYVNGFIESLKRRKGVKNINIK